MSGDRNGREVLAIMIEILEAGFVCLKPGTRYESYLWPYFAVLPLDCLTPEQEVELHELITPTGHKRMVEFGGYSFYRLGIGADGTWGEFIAGD